MSSPYIFRQIGDRMISVNRRDTTIGTNTTTTKDHEKIFLTHFGVLPLSCHRLWMELEQQQQQQQRLSRIVTRYIFCCFSRNKRDHFAAIVRALIIKHVRKGLTGANPGIHKRKHACFQRFFCQELFIQFFLILFVN